MRTFITLFIFVLLASCKDLSPIKVAPELGEVFELRVGSSVTLANSDVTITFKDVTEDSRCPRSVECFIAGEAVLSVGFNNSTIKLNTNSNLGVQVGSYTIKLEGLDPYPEHDSPTKNGDYRATFIVTKPPAFGELFELKVGESVTMANSDATILFKDVTEDTRCPRSVMCVWAGIAKLSVEFDKQPIEFDTYSKHEVKVSPYNITFVKLDPYPQDDTKIPKNKYRASFIVTKITD